MSPTSSVVIIGGGNGAANSIQALKAFHERLSLSAVVTMSDSGGSSGKLRREFCVLPPGDILRAILAASPYDYQLLKTIFRTNRFQEAGKLNSHNVGNLFFALATQYDGNFLNSLKALAQAVEASFPIYPITLALSDLCVELGNGDIIVGEDKIDRPTYDRNLRIKRAWLQPTPGLLAEAQEVIEKAETIILGPGSLYTSLVAALCVTGVKEAIDASRAKIIFIAGNAYETIGETGPTRLSDFVSELETYLPASIDVIVYCNRALNAKQRQRYQEKKWQCFEQDIERLPDRNLVGADFEKKSGGLDPKKLGEVLIKVVSSKFELF